jgi:nicotinamide-nucleotide adenylyltransferase
MKVGLVHGRFQPFHNGHKFLVNKMLEECDIGVILIGSVGKEDKKNPLNLSNRMKIIKNLYKGNKNIFIGANPDLDNPYHKNTPWAKFLSNHVLSLTGYLPTHIYAGKDYGISWKNHNVKIRKFSRFKKISGTEVRNLIENKKFDEAKCRISDEAFHILSKSV